MPGPVQLDARNHPVLVCCTSGIFQTAPLVGCLRRVQNWSLTAILDEYRAFAGPKGRLTHEQYIEFFDVDLVTLPAEDGQLPAWFIDYNLVDVRQKAIEMDDLRQRLQILEAREAADSNGGNLSDEDRLQKRRILFALRCAKAQRSTMLCSPSTRKQTLVDDDDDD